ncbi:MAG TPA: RagB/SusD family nutrient uptake outer membrane protein [Arachidicoccus sp.]|nr:RagB/SusD family nutrient uptake outer membrane protein [Arachidicoccus sp.]
MKSQFIICLVALCQLALFQSCQKGFLDKEPSDQPSGASFFANENDLKLAINGAYTGLYWESARVPYPMWLESSTDYSFDRGDYGGMLTAQSGQYGTETTVFYSIWSSLYTKIASCNNILTNMHLAKEVSNENVYNQVEGQALFLRAFFYHYLINLYGDVPFVTKSISLEEGKSLTRAPRAEIATQLLADLKTAADKLPLQWTGGDLGRITKGAALALRARIALLEGNYQVAAEAAKAVMDLNVYELYNDYHKLFQLSGENSKEAIFSLPYLRGTATSGIPQYIGIRSTQCWSIYVPSQNLVNYYECTDGKSIDKSPLYDPTNPYEGRDPRLKASILTPGQWMGGFQFETHPDSTKTSRILNGKITRVANQEVTNPFATFTGYVWKKYLDSLEVPTYNTQSELSFMFIRYAEVLLTYAEAKIELGQIDQSVIDAINKVRTRPSVTMPAVTMTTAAELRKVVRYERTVELAMEGHRLFDIRRWKYAEHVMAGNILGRRKIAFYQHPVVPTIDEYGQSHYPNEADLFNIIGVNTFDVKKDYYWPIPQKERDLNNLLSQNPGY